MHEGRVNRLNTKHEPPATPPWVDGRVLHFVRHGQYEIDASGSDRLTPLGRRQASRLAKHLARLPVAAVRSSDAVRAVETADILAAGFGATRVTRHAALREMLPARVPGVAIPRAELAEDALRLERVLEQFFRASQRIRHEILVCHGNLIRSLLLRVAAGRAAGFHRLLIHHAGVTSFSVSARGDVEVVSFNVLEHLPQKMRTYV